MRKNIVAGNWKMNLTRNEGLILVETVLSNLPNEDTEIVFAPNYLYLYKIGKMCNGFENVKIAPSK